MLEWKITELIPSLPQEALSQIIPSNTPYCHGQVSTTPLS